MPKRTPIATRESLKQVPLPQHATSYTVIEHETVIVNTLEQLKLKGFTVDQEHYRSNNSGDVAVGLYQLNYKNDPDLGMMFAWANSYDKTMRFKCAVGGFIRVSGSSMIGDDFSWSRKHTGTADQEMVAQVTNQIMNGQIYYDNLLLVRDQMKEDVCSKDRIAEFLGRAFFNDDLFTKEQIGIVRDEMQHPSYDYDARPDSLWTYYNHMLVALKRAHPRTWMEEQLQLHKAVCKEFNLVVQPVATITVTSNTGPVVIQAISNDGPVSVYSQQEEEKPVGKMNIEELAEVKQDSVFKQIITSPDEPVLKPDNSVPFLEDITPEEQALIDQRMAMLGGGKKEESIMDLNLPD